VAANVIGGRLPIDLQAKMLAARHDLKKQGVYDPAIEAAIEDEIYEQWQQRWRSSEKGRWTFRLVPEIRTWISRKHGAPNYHLTQFLTGHGCFREYLYKYRHVETPYCLHCDGVIESVEHIFCECERFSRARSTLHSIMGESVTCEGIVEHMLRSKSAWEQINHIIMEIMLQLRREEAMNRTRAN